MHKLIILLLAGSVFISAGCMSDQQSTVAAKREEAWKAAHRIEAGLDRASTALEQDRHSEDYAYDAYLAYQIYLQYSCQLKELTPLQANSYMEERHTLIGGEFYQDMESYQQQLAARYRAIIPYWSDVPPERMADFTVAANKKLTQDVLKCVKIPSE